jgi:zinc transporter 1/2/3
MSSTDACFTGINSPDMLAARISSIFVIMAGGCFGALFPIVSSRSSLVRMPAFAFFFAKYFGSGVIVATALIHLLQPANEALSDPCLGPGWEVYPYAFGICLFVMFVTFLMDIISQRYLLRLGLKHDHGPSGLESHTIDNQLAHSPCLIQGTSSSSSGDECCGDVGAQEKAVGCTAPPSLCGGSDESDADDGHSYHAMLSQIGSILFLEFGVLFHSVFIGLTLAVSGDEFKTLYIVLVFHQTFEGLGLGTRIAACKWSPSKAWVPWALGIAFGVTTPIAIAIGLGVRTTYPPQSTRSLITNGIFDSISSGILLYVGLVELMSNEFLHSDEFANAPLKKILTAYSIMALGAGLMALLGRWA